MSKLKILCLYGWKTSASALKKGLFRGINVYKKIYKFLVCRLHLGRWPGSFPSAGLPTFENEKLEDLKGCYI